MRSADDDQRQSGLSGTLPIEDIKADCLCGIEHKILDSCPLVGSSYSAGGGIEAAACECYGVIKSDYDRLLADRNANS